MLALGTIAPSFALPDTLTGEVVTLDAFTDARGLLVAFLCNHCPYVVHIQSGLVKVAHALKTQGVAVVAISSNDVSTHPEDGPEEMAKEAKRHNYPFPYLYDETQEVARAYAAACTPDFFLFDAEQRLVYRGQLDGSRPGNGVPVDGADLRRAVDEMVAGKIVSADQRPSTGCGIKWKR